MKPIPGMFALLAVVLTVNAADPSPGSFSPTIAYSSTAPGPCTGRHGVDSRRRIFDGC